MRKKQDISFGEKLFSNFVHIIFTILASIVIVVALGFLFNVVGWVVSGAEIPFACSSIACSHCVGV